jgi:hypothetical protein
MKVNQIVGEHKKGVRAKIYTRKPKAGPVPRQPIKQNEIEHPKDINEGHNHFHDWMNSEHAPYDDDAGDYHRVHQKAKEYLYGKVHPNEVDDHAEKLNREFHGEHDQEVEEDDTVKSVTGDKAVVNIAGQDQEVAASNLMPGAQPGTVALKPPEQGEIKPGMKITGSDVQSEGIAVDVMAKLPLFLNTIGKDSQSIAKIQDQISQRIAVAGAGNPAVAHLNDAHNLLSQMYKNPTEEQAKAFYQAVQKANGAGIKERQGMAESMTAKDRALLDKMLTIARLR